MTPKTIHVRPALFGIFLYIFPSGYILVHCAEGFACRELTSYKYTSHQVSNQMLVSIFNICVFLHYVPIEHNWSHLGSAEPKETCFELTGRNKIVLKSFSFSAW